jgi:hypothetical protein
LDLWLAAYASLRPRHNEYAAPDSAFARVGRTLLSDAFDFDFAFDSSCHPEEAGSHAKRATPDEEPALSLPKGPMQLAWDA